MTSKRSLGENGSAIAISGLGRFNLIVFFIYHSPVSSWKKPTNSVPLAFAEELQPCEIWQVLQEGALIASPAERYPKLPHKTIIKVIPRSLVRLRTCSGYSWFWVQRIFLHYLFWGNFLFLKVSPHHIRFIKELTPFYVSVDSSFWSWTWFQRIHSMQYLLRLKGTLFIWLLRFFIAGYIDIFPHGKGMEAVPLDIFIILFIFFRGISSVFGICLVPLC